MIAATPTWDYTYTIFIPTYNRAHTLPRALASIEAQSFRDFEVFIVDDGSSDHTQSLVETWAAQVPFAVRYHYQPNQGKHVAHNTMLQLARGEFVVLLDSDDTLVVHALERLHYHWQQIPIAHRPLFAGVEGLCTYMPDGRLAGSRFPHHVMDSNYIESRIVLGVHGEKRNALRTEVLRQFPYPVFAGERHIRPSLVWNRIARHYQMRYINEVIQSLEHQTDGLTANPFVRRMANPQGMRLCFQEELGDYRRFLSFRQRMRLVSTYVRFSLHAGVGYRQQWREMNGKATWLAGVIGGTLKWTIDRVQLRFTSPRLLPPQGAASLR